MIPIIDFSAALREGRGDDYTRLLRQVRQACGPDGCGFIATGVLTSAIVEDAILYSNRFFAMPTGAKLRYISASTGGAAPPPAPELAPAASESPATKLTSCNDVDRWNFEAGYTPLGNAEGISNHSAALRPQALHERYKYPAKRGPNEPPLVPELHDFDCALSACGDSFHYLARLILSTLDSALGWKDGSAVGPLELSAAGSTTGLVVVRYLEPQASESNGVSRPSMRAYPHADGDSLITLLVHDDVRGLQVCATDTHGGRAVEDRWLDVPPDHGGVVVLVGQMLQRWTQDALRATNHRVQRPGRELGDGLPASRLMIACFFAPPPGTLLTPPGSDGARGDRHHG